MHHTILIRNDLLLQLVSLLQLQIIILWLLNNLSSVDLSIILDHRDVWLHSLEMLIIFLLHILHHELEIDTLVVVHLVGLRKSSSLFTDVLSWNVIVESAHKSSDYSMEKSNNNPAASNLYWIPLSFAFHFVLSSLSLPKETFFINRQSSVPWSHS